MGVMYKARQPCTQIQWGVGVIESFLAPVFLHCKNLGLPAPNFFCQVVEGGEMSRAPCTYIALVKS